MPASGVPAVCGDERQAAATSAVPTPGGDNEPAPVARCCASQDADTVGGRVIKVARLSWVNFRSLLDGHVNVREHLVLVGPTPAARAASSLSPL